MRDPELELLGWVLLGGLCWLIFHFYWLRVLTGALTLILWGATAIVLPLFLAGRYLADGRAILAIVSLVVSILPHFYGA
jgi:hypothetical protein